MTRTLVATNVSTRSDRGLRRATLLAREAFADMVIIHVADDDQPPRLLQSEQQEASALLHDLAATRRKSDGVACETLLALGDPCQAIGNAAEAFDADLVVMGTHGRSGIGKFLLRNVAEDVLHGSAVNVLVVSPVDGAATSLSY